MKWIQDRGRLPTDQFGNTLEAADLVVWFGLNRVLDSEESKMVERELAALAEAEAIIDQLRATTP
jgi:hypothetical protein